MCTEVIDFVDMVPLPPHDQRHLWLHYQVEGYTEEIDLAERLRMVYTGDDSQELRGARRSMTWRQFILDLGLHTAEEMAEDGFGAYWLESERVIPDKRDLRDYWVEISSGRDFLRGAPSYTYIKDPVRRPCHRHVEGRKSDARLSGGHYIRCLAHHFSLVSDDGLRGLSVVTREIQLINMGPERHPDAVASAPEASEDALAVDEGAQADLALVQAPQPPPLPPNVGKTMPQRLGRLKEEISKTDSKFSTTGHEYVTEPSTLSKSKAELRRESVYKSVEAK
uniref:Uncharacterized protein n=1 Tax=Tanacetum cinerariifolium TaxID=118510 RepID=A0A699HF68_TANCI|nr:hypothetical protein [Tanacetum cinerariifolium]